MAGGAVPIQCGAGMFAAHTPRNRTEGHLANSDGLEIGDEPTTRPALAALMSGHTDRAGAFAIGLIHHSIA